MALATGVVEENMAEKKGRQVAAGEIWITVRVPKAVKPQLDTIADERDRSTSYVVRRFISYVLSDQARINEALQ